MNKTKYKTDSYEEIYGFFICDFAAPQNDSQTIAAYENIKNDRSNIYLVGFYVLPSTLTRHGRRRGDRGVLLGGNRDEVP